MTKTLLLPDLLEDEGESLLLPGESLHDLRGVFDGIVEAILMDRGTNTEGDVLTQTLDGRNLNDIWTEFQATLNFWNTKRSALVQSLTFPVEFPIEDVPIITGDDFEEASEFGEPKGIRGGDFAQFGYDFKWYDLAIRYTWKMLAEATAGQVENLNNQALEADNRMVFKKTMQAIFMGNTNRSTNVRNQALTVFGFYNNDGATPPPYGFNTFTNTHNHYLVSGAASVDAGDLTDMEEHLTHHGYGPQNGATLVLLANRQEVNLMRTWRVSTGSPYDFVTTSGIPWLLPVNTGGVVNPNPPSTVNGMQVEGQFGPWLVVLQDFIPPGYLFGYATGGENSASNPVGFRQHQNTGLRGLRLVKGRDNDYPLIDSFYNRGFGTGIRHRGAGVVMQVKASGSYVPPAVFA